MAQREGRSLSIRYLRTLLRREKSSFLPHLLIPPLLVNTTIGFCLFEVYTLTEARLLARYYHSDNAQAIHGKVDVNATKQIPATFTPLWIVALAGGSAGAAQCIVSAPLDNVRLVLSKDQNKPKRHQHGVYRRKRTHIISWRAVARAAVLPFAPDVTRTRLVQKVKEGPGATTASQRKEWEKRIKRWRGGVHGAGLVMSLLRDSVGFSAFFVVFEVSRRLAYRASLEIDQILAYFNTSAALPKALDEREEISSEYTPGDISYSKSRTKVGRIVAALVLVVGGAIGAAFYEIVGRPAELMRLVIWEGRKAWEEGRSFSFKQRRKPELGRDHLAGARNQARSFSTAYSSTLKRGNFLEVRSGNTNGSHLSRIEAGRLQRRQRPMHPLKLTPAPRTHVFPDAPRNPVHRRKRMQSSRLRLKVPFTQHKALKPPPLKTRPSAYELLLRHAEEVSLLKYPSARDAALRVNSTPVPAPILLLHTYFVAPFSSAPQPLDKLLATIRGVPGAGMSSVLDKNVRPNKLEQTSKSSRVHILQRITKLLPGHLGEVQAPGSVKTIAQARSWGTGRIAWSLRRVSI